jgi:hypothetical protein
MINPNNIPDLTYNLADYLDTIIPEQTVARLSEKQRNFLLVLMNKDKEGQLVNGQHPIGIMKDILGIRKALDKKDTFLKIKFN